MPDDPRPSRKVVAIADDGSLREVFSTTIVDVTLINSNALSITLGARRNMRATSVAEPKSVVFVNNRLVLPLEAAQNLAHLLSRMLRRAAELKEEDETALKRPVS